MSETTPSLQTPLQRQVVRMALILASQLEAAAEQALPGQTLADCEQLMLEQGRQFLRDSLAATLQQQIDHAEKKGGPPASVLADTLAATREPRRASSSRPSARSA
jgi:hypothetical protein